MGVWVYRSEEKRVAFYSDTPKHPHPDTLFTTSDRTPSRPKPS